MNLVEISFNTLCVGSINSPGGDRIRLRKFVEHIEPFLKRWNERNPNGIDATSVRDVVKFFEGRQCLNCRKKSRVCRHGDRTRVDSVSANFTRLVAELVRLRLRR